MRPARCGQRLLVSSFLFHLQNVVSEQPLAAVAKVVQGIQVPLSSHAVIQTRGSKGQVLLLFMPMEIQGNPNEVS